MKKHVKVILIILIIIVAIPVAYVGYKDYQYNSQQELFNKTIKEVSDIENKSDTEAYDFIKDKSYTTDNMMKYYDIHNVTQEEIEKLQELDDKLSNQTLKDYVQLQIKRISAEETMNKASMDQYQATKKYNDNEMSYVNYRKVKGDTDETMSKYRNMTSEYKRDSQTYLSSHPDLRQQLEDLGIDEDFMIEEIQQFN